MAKVAIVPVTYELSSEVLPFPEGWKIKTVADYNHRDAHITVEADEFIDVPYGMPPPHLRVLIASEFVDGRYVPSFKSAEYEYHKADYDYHVAMAAALKKGGADGNDAPEVLDAAGTGKGLDSNS